MKLKFAAIAIVLLSACSGANAALSPGDAWQSSELSCRLNDAEAAALKASWTHLARRLFFASLEVMEDPIQFEKVRKDVDRGLAELRRQYGFHCVRPIG